MVAENIKQAVVACCWVAGNARGNDPAGNGISGAANFGTADQEIVKISGGVHGSEANLAPVKAAL